MTSPQMRTITKTLAALNTLLTSEYNLKAWRDEADRLADRMEDWNTEAVAKKLVRAYGGDMKQTYYSLFAAEFLAGRMANDLYNHRENISEWMEDWSQTKQKLPKGLWALV